MADAPITPEAQSESDAVADLRDQSVTVAPSTPAASAAAPRRRRAPKTKPSDVAADEPQSHVETEASAPAALTEDAVAAANVQPVAQAPNVEAPESVDVSLAVAAPVTRTKSARTRRASAAKGATTGTTTVTQPRASTRRTSRPTVVPSKPRLPRSGNTVVDGIGVPVFGARHGAPQIIDWSGLADEYRRGSLISFLRHRRWVYATAATDRIFIAVAIVDGGPSGTAFCMITDLATGEVLADSSRPGGMRPLVAVNNHPLEGLSASYRLPGTDYRFERPQGSSETRVTVRLRRTADSLPGLRWVPGISTIPVLKDLPTASAQPWLDIDLTLEAGVAPALTAISPVKADGGLVTSTIKTSTMNTWGTITLHGETTRTLSLDGGTGAMDYTNGFLPRHTHWKWASTTGRLADGRLFGLNLVSDFAGIGDETNENAVWLDGALSPLNPGVRILLDKDNLSKPWTVRTIDGSVHLHFQPLSIHREGLNLGVIRSRFVQPTGLFSGHVMVEGERVVIDRMPGVVEDQDIVW